MLSWVVTSHGGEQFFLEMPHLLYYEFAKRSFFKHQGFLAEVERIFKKTSMLKAPDQESVLYENRLAMNDVLVYGALSLEAYINYYGMRYDIPFHNDFERSLSTINKWKVYPRLKNGRTLDVNALKVIKKVFELRDDIVHPKPERILAGSKEPAKEKSAQAKIERIDKGEMMIELNSVFQAVHRIDADERAEYEKRPWLCNLQRVEMSDPRA